MNTSTLLGKTPQSERFRRGWQQLEAIDGVAGRQVIDSLPAIAPDLARYVIEFPPGDIYARPELNLKSREIAPIAALTALGNAQPQLKVHIQATLNAGYTREVNCRSRLPMAIYAGLLAVLNGMTLAKGVYLS